MLDRVRSVIGIIVSAFGALRLWRDRGDATLRELKEAKEALENARQELYDVYEVLMGDLQEKAEQDLELVYEDGTTETITQEMYDNLERDEDGRFVSKDSRDIDHAQAETYR